MSGEGRELMQLVTVVRGADRHEDVHERRFAEAVAVAVPAGPPEEVVGQALSGFDLPRGRYVITVGWPYEGRADG